MDKIVTEMGWTCASPGTSPLTGIAEAKKMLEEAGLTTTHGPVQLFRSCLCAVRDTLTKVSSEAFRPG